MWQASLSLWPPCSVLRMLAPLVWTTFSDRGPMPEAFETLTWPPSLPLGPHSRPGSGPGAEAPGHLSGTPQGGWVPGAALSGLTPVCATRAGP